MPRGKREPHFDADLAELQPAEMRIPVSRLSEEVQPPRDARLKWWRWSIGCAILIGIFVAWPLLREEASGPCQAIELRSLGIIFSDVARQHRENPMTGVMAEALRRGMASGEFAAAVVRSRYQGIPSPVACTALYWRSLFDPSALRLPRSE